MIVPSVGILNAGGTRCRWSVFGPLVKPAKQSSSRFFVCLHALNQSMKPGKWRTQRKGS